MILTLALAIAPQALPTRAITEHASDSNTFNLSDATVSSGSLSIGANASAFELSSPAPGVQLAQVDVEGFVSYDISLRLSALIDGTALSGSYFYFAAACGNTCSWGPFDGDSSGGSIASAGQAGDVLESSISYFESYSHTLTPQSYGWSQVSNSVSFNAHVDSSGSWSTSAPVDVQAIDHRADAEFDLTVTYNLLPAAAQTYCTSEVGTTGALTLLQAFGSTEASANLLTIRAQGVPQGAAGILFVGQQPASTPMSTFTLCLGGSLVRTGGVRVEENGALDFPVDLDGSMSGQSLYLQSIFRDPLLGIAASSAVQVDLN